MTGCDQQKESRLSVYSGNGLAKPRKASGAAVLSDAGAIAVSGRAGTGPQSQGLLSSMSGKGKARYTEGHQRKGLRVSLCPGGLGHWHKVVGAELCCSRRTVLIPLLQPNV